MRIASLRACGGCARLGPADAKRDSSVEGASAQDDVRDRKRGRRPHIVLAAAQAGNGKRGIVWLRFRRSPFQPDWDVFDVSGPEVFDLNLLLDVDSDSDPDVINSEEIEKAGDRPPGLGVV